MGGSHVLYPRTLSRGDWEPLPLGLPSHPARTATTTSSGVLTPPWCWGPGLPSQGVFPEGRPGASSFGGLGAPSTQSGHVVAPRHL